MAHSAAPAAEHENLRNPNVTDIRGVADSMSDDDFFSDFAESRSSDHEQHEREDTDLSGEARRAADDLTLDEGEEPAQKPRKRQKPEPEQEEAPDDEEAADEAPETKDGDEEEGEEQPEDGSEPEAKEAKDGKDAKPDRINLRDDATIVIDGHEITGAEVKRGFLRQADYTRKTQEVSQLRHQLAQREEEVRNQQEEIVQILNIATDVTGGMLPKEPDLANYDVNDARSIASYLYALDQYKKQVEGIRQTVQSRQTMTQQQEAQKRAAAEAQEQERQQTYQARLQNEQRLLLEKIPEFRTSEGRNNFAADVEKYGGHFGLTPADVSQLQDHRQYAVLRDAIAYRKLQAAKPAAVKQAQAAPPIRPAARPASGTRAADPRRSAEDRFRRDPTLRNAAATLPDSLFE